jgi:hypothetical protein
MNTTDRPGVVALVTDALGRSADLIQTEIRLARVELGEKADALKTSVVSGLVMMLIGTVFIIGALILVLQALVAARRLHDLQRCLNCGCRHRNFGAAGDIGVNFRTAVIGLGCHALNPSRASGRCCLRCCCLASAARAAARPLSSPPRWLTWTTWSLRARPRQFAVWPI